MSINRIVSFLPSATELLYEFGVQDMLYGVTHECKFPDDAAKKPCVIRSVIDSESLSSKDIDKKTCRLLFEKKDIFVLDEKNLIDAEPDLIISQETCEVCAAYTSQVNKAVRILEKEPLIHSMNPHDFSQIIESVKELGTILEREEKAKEIIRLLEKRIQKIKTIVELERKPRIIAIEWIEPFFTAGHWIPQMIEIAGGINMISRKGEHSTRLSIEEITLANPEIIILMPCGFGINRTISEYNAFLKDRTEWKEIPAVKNKKVFAVDANSFFSKPSIRTVTGLEILSKIFHPKITGDIRVPNHSFTQIK
ncbi:MAG: cobalamin-binding protein [Nitrosarchaeum sp.]|nr:cobalamin-binding protein [Nitrosarchaeum sp.]MCA9819612.1 cobalamin-binding protein [Nitrosarchaeum sp.]